MIPSSPRRVVFFGVTGSGKSTAAQSYAAATGLPLVEVDSDIGWLPGWVERNLAEQNRIVEEIASRDEWVFDSFYGRWSDRLIPRAEAIIALDYPRWVSLARLLRRTMRRMVLRERVCNGNTETFGRAVARDSIIRWHFKSFESKKARIRAYQEAGLPVLHFTNPSQLEQWLRSFER
ncbi:AAA family ATPase [Arthrobacter tecti]